MYLNLKGREAQGIVEPVTEAAALKAEIIRKLSGLLTGAGSTVAIREAFAHGVALCGSIRRECARPADWLQRGLPHLMGRRHRGCRRTCDRGQHEWSGDHCIDPRLVPGVFFCNRSTKPPTPRSSISRQPHSSCSGLSSAYIWQWLPALDDAAAAWFCCPSSPWPHSCSRCRDVATHRPLGRRVVILGFDGLDFGLTRDLMAQGRLPNFVKSPRVARSLPSARRRRPQSPVAWSSFITGLDPGGHHIFDFIHRDPKTMTPYLSTTRTAPPSHFVPLGRWHCR